MSESVRPSFQSVQRSLIIGILVGLIFGCVLGTPIGLWYAWQISPAVYVGDAIPSELAPGYKNHYLTMVVDSYIINQDANVASQRLTAFDNRDKVRILAERSAAYVAAGRAAEAQYINNLALALKGTENWDEETIKSVVAELTTQYQSDPARAQAISTFSAQLLGGQVPVPAASPPAAQAETPAAAPAATPAPEAGGGIPWLQVALCCLVLLIVGALAFVLVGRYRNKQRMQPKPVVWEGEGPAPLKQWSGTYNFGDDNYDEFFTIETVEGDFLGESGIQIMGVVPGSKPKQVLSFDVGLFDKTDITTLSRVIMSEYAYNDESQRGKVEANPQAEAILAEPGKRFSFETSAMRVEVEIEEVEYGEGNKYFTKLKSNLKVFLKEGADIKRGQMDIPDEYR
jgi:hypothetical protein